MARLKKMEEALGFVYIYVGLFIVMEVCSAGKTTNANLI